ncbi:MAG: 3'(2'),5'-bisphosphate nucleotidase CysQ [Hyphomonadaceae bacterium]|nr:3'(2'),5'-bisphosphate nucleotidase CysQ [Hyphomonadaceae bacterium]
MTADFASPAERNRLARLFGAISSDAGIAVMEVYQSDFETRTKADRSPVSDADEKAEEIILARLDKELPGIPVLAEEQAARDGVGGSIADAFLLVDPVDGTKEFIQRKGDFTVNIALIVGGRPVAGCVYAPARQEMYFGGAEARLIEGFAPGAKLTEGRVLATRAYPDDGLVAITSSSHLNEETKKFLARHRIKASTAIGSSLKFCWVAAGKADVYPRWGPTMEWDTAAGHAVLQAAGGRMLRPDGSDFLYGKADKGFANGPFIAWGREPL